MKNKEILDLINVLSSFKLNKVNDEIAEIILTNITKIVPYNEAFLKVQDQLRKLTIESIDRSRLEEFESERLKFVNLKGEEKQLKENWLIANYKDVIEQQARLIKALNKYLSKDVDIELDKVDFKTFCKNIKYINEDISYADLTLLKPMFNNFYSNTIEVDNDDIKELLN